MNFEHEFFEDEVRDGFLCQRKLSMRGQQN